MAVAELDSTFVLEACPDTLLDSLSDSTLKEARTMVEPERTREQRIRRAARRQALDLRKSRTRDARALDFGLYALDSHLTGKRTWGYNEMDRPSKTLDEIESFLDGRLE